MMTSTPAVKIKREKNQFSWVVEGRIEVTTTFGVGRRRRLTLCLLRALAVARYRHRKRLQVEGGCYFRSENN